MKPGLNAFTILKTKVQKKHAVYLWLFLKRGGKQVSLQQPMVKLRKH